MSGTAFDSRSVDYKAEDLPYETQLFRQIQQRYFQPGDIAPDPDSFSTQGHGQISCYNSQEVTPEDAIAHFNEGRDRNHSVGIMGVPVGYCLDLGFKVALSQDFYSHASIIPPETWDKSEKREKLELLHEKAVTEGWILLA